MEALRSEFMFIFDVCPIQCNSPTLGNIPKTHVKPKLASIVESECHHHR